MKTIKLLEEYKGELNGTYQTLWVACDENNRLYITSDLELKEEGNKIVNDIESTKWKSISNEYHHMISDEMHRCKVVDYRKPRENTEREIRIKRPKGRGLH